jgi:peptidoglycan hydrolase FlgJ
LAISTHGDLVLDVVRAADPAAAEAARSRLASMAGRTAETGFSVELAPGAGAAGRADGATATPEAFAKFEAMVLQTFIQSMLPKDTESVYGEGMAGEMWQSMLAEQLGTVMAARGGIGIADRILRDHYVVEGEKVALQGVANDPAKPERDEQQMLSVALVQEIQRKLANSLSEDRLASSAVTTR